LFLKKDKLSKPFEKFWLLNTDSSSLYRLHSPSLPERRYVYRSNNQVKGNKPVEVGYEMSVVGLSARTRLYGTSTAPWNLPLSMRLIPFAENRNSFTAKQVNDLLNNKDLPFGNALTVNALDSAYSSPEYIADTYEQENLVNIIRLASNRNVWKKLTVEAQSNRRTSNQDNRGANAIYGKKYQLNKYPDWDNPPDTEEKFGIKLSNGKACLVEISIWEEMLIRTQRGKNMKNKSFRLVKVRLLDAQTGQPTFKKDMWLGVWGKRNKELTGEEIFWSFRNRYDIEHFFRFGKQRLLLDKFQTPDEEHLQNWLEVVSSAYWLLWVGSDQANYQVPKWQQYDSALRKRETFNLRPSPSQVQNQMQTIILGFEQEPFLPKLQIKGNGRKKGSQMPKRKRFPIKIKGNKAPRAA